MSTPDTFRDALADELHDFPDSMWAHWRDRQLSEALADAVLASDEMQAIRKALQRSASNAARYAYPQGRPDLRVRGYLENNCGLPAHLIAWVLDDPSPEEDNHV